MTGIEWTDATWNPLRGCSRISEGCRHCYAERFAARFAGAGQPYAGLVRETPNGPRWTGKLQFVADKLREPLHWRKPRAIFVNSMSDLFHEAMAGHWIDQVFAVMAAAPRHRFQVLTKRPALMAEYLLHPDTRESIEEEMARLELGPMPAWPLANVWLGFSAETQEKFDARFLDCDALPRRGWRLFASLEPLLEPIDARPVLRFQPRLGLHWVIVGGESGAGARICRVSWIRDIVRACDKWRVPCFVKQLGAEALGDDLEPLTLASRKGADLDEWPADLRVRQIHPELIPG